MAGGTPRIAFSESGSGSNVLADTNLSFKAPNPERAVALFSSPILEL
jgi:hypothetical protein